VIVGVVKDFNFKPAQQAIEPLVMPFNRADGFVLVRTQAGETTATIDALKQISQRLNPAFPFQFNFLDQQLAKLYQSEQKIGNIFNLFALLGIFISCLGLYGLSAFMAEQRTKEIGVRKVLGASIASLIYLMTNGVTKLLLLAICIAIPLAWYAAQQWLTGFAYHIDISWVIFAIAALAVLATAWLIAGVESVRAAMANPVKSLKAE
jgi:ABC-type antimicrobial peptide transport system permease subunit